MGWSTRYTVLLLVFGYNICIQCLKNAITLELATIRVNNETLSHSQMVYTNSFLFWGVLLGSIISGFLADYSSYRAVIVSFGLLGSLFTLAVPFAAWYHFALFCLSQFLVGFFACGVFIASMGYVVKWALADELLIWAAWIAATDPAGTVLAAILGGFFTQQPENGVQNVFTFYIILGGIGTVLSICVIWCLPESPFSCSGVEDDELASLPTREKVKFRLRNVPFSEMLSSGHFWVILCIFFLISFVVKTQYTIQPIFTRDVTDHSLSIIGLITATGLLVQMFGTMLGSIFLERISRDVDYQIVMKVFFSACVVTPISHIISTVLVEYNLLNFDTMLLLSYAGCVPMLIVGIGLPQAAAPGFPATLFGLIKGIGSFGSIASIYAIEGFTANKGTPQQWRHYYVLELVCVLLVVFLVWILAEFNTKFYLQEDWSGGKCDRGAAETVHLKERKKFTANSIPATSRKDPTYSTLQ